MPAVFNNFRKILIFPKSDFGKEEDVANLARIEGFSDWRFLLFDYVAIAAILDADGRIFWPATLFLLEIARRSASVTGDTVRTYSESLLTFLNFLSDKGLCSSDVTEEQWGSFRAYLRRGSRNYALNTVNLHLNVAEAFRKCGISI